MIQISERITVLPGMDKESHSPQYKGERPFFYPIPVLFLLLCQKNGTFHSQQQPK